MTSGKTAVNFGAEFNEGYGVKGPQPPPPRAQKAMVKEETSGCCASFSKGIRYIWATKQNLDLKNNSDLRVKTTFKELIIYCLFLVVLCVMTFGMTSPINFYYANVLNTLFIQTPGDPSNPTSNYLGLNLHSDFFDYVESVLIPGLYTSWESWYNDDTTPEEGYRFIFYENKIQGVPRMRQLRVMSNSCIVHDDFKSQITACYAGYSPRVADTSPFGVKNGTAWTYSSQDVLKALSVTGEANSYDGGGFYQDLNTTSNASLAIVDVLKRRRWVDRATRAVFIDFTVYNANINLFCSVKLIVEFPPTGGIIPSYNIRPAKLIRYNTMTDYIILGFEIAFCMFVIYYIVEEILEVKKLGCAYLKEFWNVLDIIVLLIAICCIAFDVYCFFEVRKQLNIAFLNPDKYVDFDFLTYWQVIFSAAMAIMAFLAWIKLFKYISFSKTMSQLSLTLGASSKDLAGFSVMFFIIFLAFAQLGYLMFGTQVADFNTFSNSIFTLFRIILGDFNFQALQQANRVLGPIYFILYVFFVFFILLNMFLAIINDTYSEVKADLLNKPSEIDVYSFFKKRANTVLEKLNLRKSKITVIESALATADVDGDKIIDFEEWRRDLQSRGYGSDEIEAVFAKYDKNNDRQLDEKELQKMKAELEGEKVAIDNDISDMNDGKPGGGGPFGVLENRVDKMESSIGSVVTKINSILTRLESMEQAKVKRRENIKKIMDDIVENDGLCDNMAQQQMEKIIKEELHRWENEFSKRMM